MNPVEDQIEHQRFRAHGGHKIDHPVHMQRSLRIKQAGSNNHKDGPGGNPFIRIFRGQATAHLKAYWACRQGVSCSKVVTRDQIRSHAIQLGGPSGTNVHIIEPRCGRRNCCAMKRHLVSGFSPQSDSGPCSVNQASVRNWSSGHFARVLPYRSSTSIPLTPSLKDGQGKLHKTGRGLTYYRISSVNHQSEKKMNNNPTGNHLLA